MEMLYINRLEYVEKPNHNGTGRLLAIWLYLKKKRRFLALT